MNLNNAKTTIKSTHESLVSELNRTYRTFKKHYVNELFHSGQKTKAVHSVAHAIKWKAKNH